MFPTRGRVLPAQDQAFPVHDQVVASDPRRFPVRGQERARGRERAVVFPIWEGVIGPVNQILGRPVPRAPICLIDPVQRDQGRLDLQRVQAEASIDPTRDGRERDVLTLGVPGAGGGVARPLPGDLDDFLGIDKPLRPTPLPGRPGGGNRPERPGGGDRPGIGDRPGLPGGGNRPGTGDRPGIGDRPGQPGGGDRPGAGNRPGTRAIDPEPALVIDLVDQATDPILGVRVGEIGPLTSAISTSAITTSSTTVRPGRILIEIRSTTSIIVGRDSWAACTTGEVATLPVAPIGTDGRMESEVAGGTITTMPRGSGQTGGEHIGTPGVDGIMDMDSTVILGTTGGRCLPSRLAPTGSVGPHLRPFGVSRSITTMVKAAMWSTKITSFI